jgi:uncharacterized protein DUF4082/fibronectin type III domain protein
MIDKSLFPFTRWKFALAGMAAILLASFSVAQGATSATLSWNASTGSPAGYRIHYGTSSTNLSVVKDAGKVLTATVSSLTAGLTYYFDVTAYNSAGVESAPSNKVSMTASAAAATPTPKPTATPTPTPPTTLFASSNTPAIVTENDPNPVELGLKFQTSMTRQVLGFRFYKGPKNTGTHTGHLWNSAGTLLASAVFTNETSSGWQQVTLANPVSISPGTTYIVSYFSHGYYSDTYYYFNNTYIKGSLTAPSSSSSGGNGVYSYSASSVLPRSSYQAANYWIDVLLK